MDERSQGFKQNRQEEETTPDHNNTQWKQTPSMTGDAVQGITRTILSSLLSILFLLLYHLFHEADVVKFGKIAVFEEIWSVMLRHGLDEVFNDLVWDKGVSEIEFGNIWLA